MKQGGVTPEGIPGPWNPPPLPPTLPAPDPEPVLARTQFRITVADITAAWRANLRWRYMRLNAMTIPAALGLIAAVVASTVYPRAGAALLAAPLIGIPALVVLGRLCRYALLPLLARRIYWQTRSYQEEWSVELTRSGNRARAAGIEHFVPWTNYVAWSETDRVILLYHSDMLFQFVPKPAVETDTMQVFRSLVAGLKKR